MAKYFVLFRQKCEPSDGITPSHIEIEHPGIYSMKDITAIEEKIANRIGSSAIKAFGQPVVQWYTRFENKLDACESSPFIITIGMCASHKLSHLRTWTEPLAVKKCNVDDCDELAIYWTAAKVNGQHLLSFDDGYSK